ncbi:hypothetical protein ABK040_003560 [Willaertia magna]
MNSNNISNLLKLTNNDHSSTNAVSGNILFPRPIRKFSGRVNDQSVDKEYQKEVKQLEARRLRYSQVMEHRKKVLDGTTTDKVQLQIDRKKEIDKHIEVKRIKEKEIEVLERNSHQKVLQYHDKKGYQDNINSDRRKQNLRSIMEENRKMAEQQKQQRKREVEENRRQERVVLSQDFLTRNRTYM